MKRSTTWAIVGGLWGSALALLFGVIPTFILVDLLDDFWPSTDDSASAAFIWGACSLCVVAIGAITGYLLGRETPRKP